MKNLLPISRATADEWKKFDVIILGDLDASFLSQGQQRAIEQACADGAGLLMIGGQKNFGPGNYQQTPIEKALPVFVGDTQMPQESQAFVPRLTADGAAHPAMEGLTPWFGVADQPPKTALPNLTGNVVVAKAKSGAQVLLIHPGRSGPDGLLQIVLASQFYGKGRSMAFTADTTWRWSFAPGRQRAGKPLQTLLGTDDSLAGVGRRAESASTAPVSKPCSTKTSINWAKAFTCGPWCAICTATPPNTPR